MMHLRLPARESSRPGSHADAIVLASSGRGDFSEESYLERLPLLLPTITASEAADLGFDSSKC